MKNNLTTTKGTNDQAKQKVNFGFLRFEKKNGVSDINCYANSILTAVERIRTVSYSKNTSNECKRAVINSNISYIKAICNQINETVEERFVSEDSNQ